MSNSKTKYLCLLAAGCGVASVLFGASAARAQQTAIVTIDDGAPLGRVPKEAFGLNTSVWDGHLADAGVAADLRSLGLTAMRYPGGSTSDDYHWQVHNTTPPHTSNFPANTDFDHYMALMRSEGFDPIITVNYGSNAEGTGGGDPSEAAAWVKYANVTKGYGVKYWEIGNEVYGNGYYGGAWETDLHAPPGTPQSSRLANPALSPTAYANNVLAYLSAMKAVDPTIKVGVVLCAPTVWPDGQPPQDWNSTVLGICGRKIDFVCVHWYPENPGHESNEHLLASPAQIPAMAEKLHAQILQYCGGNASNVEYMVTETNSVSSRPGKQSVGIVNALFEVNDYLEWLENGAESVDWWQLHNGPSNGNEDPALYGTADYGDYGILSNGDGHEPPAETPYPSFYGLQILQHLERQGDEMLAAVSDSPMITAHAARGNKRRLGVILVNTDPTNGYAVRLMLKSGKAAGKRATIYSYGPSSDQIATSEVSDGSTIAVPAYSIVAVETR